ncbi:hypothetical protein HF846_04075 [Clostridium cadaveris]|uniref:Uncharacterized protein n=1 Tax=Clostridium cadaveris TaxID=1529 RepID=A0A316M0U1_9CLOT|nr:hypothetical protein [Clostridium cadaveris]MDM8310827.1 hypothetical protein [Clostridium cadaveris]MDU4953765.1 hypothetical protein [Clostridium sp.]NME63778.1 hypothetical protein [Clostridium cadaveris]PWL51771.1 MAG: hypothetical protein DBY38_12560 [Clostridium cadaveris]
MDYRSEKELKKNKVRRLVDEISVSENIAHIVIESLRTKYEIEINEVREFSNPVRLIIKIYEVLD